jgi:hypothetical protein
MAPIGADEPVEEEPAECVDLEHREHEEERELAAPQGPFGRDARSSAVDDQWHVSEPLSVNDPPAARSNRQS